MTPSQLEARSFARDYARHQKFLRELDRQEYRKKRIRRAVEFWLDAIVFALCVALLGVLMLFR